MATRVVSDIVGGVSVNDRRQLDARREDIASCSAVANAVEGADLPGPQSLAPEMSLVGTRVHLGAMDNEVGEEVADVNMFEE